MKSFEPPSRTSEIGKRLINLMNLAVTISPITPHVATQFVIKLTTPDMCVGIVRAQAARALRTALQLRVQSRKNHHNKLN